MKLVANNLEIRGIEHKTSEKGSYYIVHVEEQTGEAFKLFARNDEGFDSNLKKGDIVNCLLDYNDKYKSLVLLAIQHNKNKVENK